MNFIKKCLLTVMAVSFATPMLPLTIFTKAYLFENKNKEKYILFEKSPNIKKDVGIIYVNSKNDYSTVRDIKKEKNNAEETTKTIIKDVFMGIASIIVNKHKDKDQKKISYRCKKKQNIQSEREKIHEKGYTFVTELRIVENQRLESFSKKASNPKKNEKVAKSINPTWKKWVRWSAPLAAIGTVAGVIIYKCWNQLKR